MTFTEQIITIAAVVAGTMLTRFLPFILFPANNAACSRYGHACCLLP